MEVVVVSEVVAWEEGVDVMVKEDDEGGEKGRFLLEFHP